jgi:hypothetical protein
MESIEEKIISSWLDQYKEVFMSGNEATCHFCLQLVQTNKPSSLPDNSTQLSNSPYYLIPTVLTNPKTLFYLVKVKIVKVLSVSAAFSYLFYMSQGLQHTLKSVPSNLEQTLREEQLWKIYTQKKG